MLIVVEFFSRSSPEVINLYVRERERERRDGAHCNELIGDATAKLQSDHFQYSAVGLNQPIAYVGTFSMGS